MKQRLRTVAALAAIILMALPALAAADSTDPVVLSIPCAGCHGTDGNSMGAMPTINGKAVAFISKALKDFRDGNRPSTIMQRIAKGYTDAQIEALARHYGK